MPDASAAGPSSSSARIGLRGKHMGRTANWEEMTTSGHDIQSRPLSDSEFDIDFWQCVRVWHLLRQDTLSSMAALLFLVYICQSRFECD